MAVLRVVVDFHHADDEITDKLQEDLARTLTDYAEGVVFGSVLKQTPKAEAHVRHIHLHDGLNYSCDVCANARRDGVV